MQPTFSSALTGDHGRNLGVNRLLRACQVREVGETQAREAARLRAATGCAGTISAVDSIVAAVAGADGRAVVRTGNPLDLRALGEHVAFPISIAWL